MAATVAARLKTRRDWLLSLLLAAVLALCAADGYIVTQALSRQSRTVPPPSYGPVRSGWM